MTDTTDTAEFRLSTAAWKWGALGGAIVAVVALFTEEINPLRTYVIVTDNWITFAAITGWCVRLMVLSWVGALWVKALNECVPIKAIQLGIAAPAALATMAGITTNLNGKEYPYDPRNDYDVQIFDAGLAGLSGRPLQVAEIENAVEAGSGDVKSDQQRPSPIIASMIARFSAPSRKEASDALVRLYEEDPSSRAEIVSQLVNGLLTSGQFMYRINLYIARTLGSIEPSWTGSVEQRDKINKQSQIFNDKTMQYWVKRAVDQWSATP